MESDGGEREEWWTVMNGGRGEGWGLMEGEGVLLGHRHPCAHSRCPVYGHSLCVGGTSSLSKGGMSSSVGGGRWLWAGSLFVGTGLSIVAGGACSRGRGVCGCWFTIYGHGGDVSSAVWSSLARLEGMRVGVLTIDDSIKNNNEQRHHHCLSFGCHVALGNVAPENCPVWSLVRESGWREAVIQNKNIKNDDER